MKRKSKIALLVLVFALLCSACAVFVSAADSKTIDSGLYDGSQELPTASGWPYQASTNAEIVTSGDETYYKIVDGQKQLNFNYTAFGTSNSMLTGEYSYLTFQIDFRITKPANWQVVDLFTFDSGSNNLFYLKYVQRDGEARLYFSENYSSHYRDDAYSFWIKDPTVWHHLEYEVKLPQQVDGAYADNAEIRVFLDGEEILTKLAGNSVVPSNTKYPRFFQISTQNIADGTIHFDNLRAVTYGTGEFFRAELNGTKYEDFADAFAAAKAGDTVTLLQNMTEADTVTVDKEINVETNGKSFCYSVVGNLAPEKDGTLYTFKEPTGAVKNSDGSIQYFTDAESEMSALKEAIAGMKDGDVLTLYKDYTITETLKLPSISGSVAFDLNGHRLTVTSKLTVIESNCGLSLYSSVKGGTVENTSTPAEGNGNGVLFVHQKGSLSLGVAPDGTTYSKENLTFSGANLLLNYATGAIDITLRNFVFSNMFGDSQAMIELHATPTVTIDGCDFIFDLANESNSTGIGNKALFADRSTATGTIDVTATNSNFYISGTDRLVKNIIKVGSGSHVFNLTFGEGTVLVTEKENLLISRESTAVNDEVNITFATGVKLSHVQGADGISLVDASAKIAHIVPATVSFGGRNFTVAYAVTTDYATLTFKDGETVLAEEFWVKGENPTEIRVSLADGYYTTIDNAEAITADKTYEADATFSADTKILSSVSQIKGNLTLYSALTLNFYIAKDSLAKTVKFADGEVVDLTTLRTVTIDGQEYYLYQVKDKAPKDLVAAFTIELGLGDIGTYTVKSSLVKYAASVLANESEIEEGKTLVKALLDYVRKTAQQFGADASDIGITAISNLLTKYSYVMPGWQEAGKDIQTVTAGNVFKSAALNLDSTPGFLFFVADDFTGEITVTCGNTVKVYTKNDIKQYNTADGTKSAIRVDLHASEYRELITLTAGDETMTYNLDTYILSQKTSFVAPTYLQALYAYSVAAEAYLAAQN